MTTDGLVVAQLLFTSIWRLFTSWYIPGTRITPASWALFSLSAVLLVKVVKSFASAGGGSD